MSAKNQSESTATVQEERSENSPDHLTEEGTVVEIEGTSQAVMPGDQDDDQNNRQDEAALSEQSFADEVGEIEFKLTDRRRFMTGIEVAADPDDETEATAEAEYEIDLDQLTLDSQAAERELEDMRVKLKESEARRDEALKTSEEYADRFRKAQLQLRAETEEVRARMQRTFEQKLEHARGDVVAGLLDTLDNLQRAVGAADVLTEQGAAFDSLRDGVRATAEMFEGQLKKMGLQAVACEGEPFNPELHDAVELAIVPPEQDNLVLAELQRGYKFGERLLRPARVKVGRTE